MQPVHDKNECIRKAQQENPDRQNVKRQCRSLQASVELGKADISSHCTAQSLPSPGRGCTTTSQPIYCQGGRKSASLVLATQPRCTVVPDWLTSFAVQTHLLGLVTVFIWSAMMVASWHPQQVQPGRRVGLGRGRATQPRDLIPLYTPVRALRSSSQSRLTIPGFHENTSKKRFGARSFRSSAPALWNSLPQSLKVDSSSASFKRQLKTHLFSKF